jgi:hypothetical protein
MKKVKRKKEKVTEFRFDETNDPAGLARLMNTIVGGGKGLLKPGEDKHYSTDHCTNNGYDEWLN